MVQGFPGGKVVKSPPANAGDTGSIPGSGRSPGREDSNPLQYSCLETPIDSGAWRAAVCGVAKSQTCLSMHAVVIQWIGIGALTVRAWVQSLVREPRSHKSLGVAKNKKAF